MKKDVANKNILDVHKNTIYYDQAAAPDALDVFWNHNSIFYEFFKRLDLRSVIELACGCGRHVPKYQRDAGEIVLVDALDENINYCRKAYQDRGNIIFYANNGVDLNGLDTNYYTSMFTYDAVVHFELIDVWGYLRETHRVLQNGGLALFHHSNFSGNPLGGWTENPHNRNFMSMDIFGHLADRAGFSILEQKAIDWGSDSPLLDGITLLKKIM
jgi:ubiquinone/menaquinone biosynthesis C-methylase UbiE